MDELTVPLNESTFLHGVFYGEAAGLDTHFFISYGSAWSVTV